MTHKKTIFIVTAHYSNGKSYQHKFDNEAERDKRKKELDESFKMKICMGFSGSAYNPEVHNSYTTISEELEE